MRHSALLILAFGATALVAGCDSLPDYVPHIDLSGLFGGNQPAQTPAQTLDVVQMTPALALRFRGVTLKDSKIDPGSNEITLRFADKANAGVVADIQRAAPDWIAGAQSSGDTATVVARKDVVFSTAPTTDGFVLILKPNETADAPEAAPTEPVETGTLRGDVAAADGGTIDGLQREDLRGAFGVDGKTRPLTGSL
ncbi:MAG TPA: hypothetical protein VG867_06565 [Rhizomicrobium sp.]|nr:hypothetical protein [Rhizomicrobium sp.]